MNKYDLILISEGILLVIICFIGGYASHDGLKIIADEYFSRPIDMNNYECANMSLTDATECMRTKVRSIYNYTKRSDIPRTYEDIKNNGGDCYDYTMLYKEMTKGTGYNFTTLNIPHHVAAVIYQNDMYCVLDQTVLIGCLRLGNMGGENE